MYPTKPGVVAEDVLFAMHWATEMAERKEAGLTVTLDDLTPWQWAAVTGLNRGNRQYEAESTARERAKLDERGE